MRKAAPWYRRASLLGLQADLGTVKNLEYPGSEAPKSRPRGSKTPPRPPKIPPRPLKTAPGNAQEPPEVLINWRGGTKAQPSTIRRPTGSACEITPPRSSYPSVYLLPDSSSQRFLFPPPKSSPSSLGPTPSSAAICGAGASWRLLGRKNRHPRCLQKLIKFWCQFNIDF